MMEIRNLARTSYQNLYPFHYAQWLILQLLTCTVYIKLWAIIYNLFMISKKIYSSCQQRKNNADLWRSSLGDLDLLRRSRRSVYCNTMCTQQHESWDNIHRIW